MNSSDLFTHILPSFCWREEFYDCPSEKKIITAKWSHQEISIDIEIVLMALCKRRNSIADKLELRLFCINSLRPSDAYMRR